jgi:hypothetical protein
MDSATFLDVDFCERATRISIGYLSVIDFARVLSRLLESGRCPL